MVNARRAGNPNTLILSGFAEEKIAKSDDRIAGIVKREVKRVAPGH